MAETTFVTYQDAADRTGIPVWKWRKWVWSDRLAVYRFDGPSGRAYLKWADVTAFLEEHRST